LWSVMIKDGKPTLHRLNALRKIDRTVATLGDIFARQTIEFWRTLPREFTEMVRDFFTLQGVEHSGR
jgi:hypothetical protein